MLNYVKHTPPSLTEFQVSLIYIKYKLLLGNQ